MKLIDNKFYIPDNMEQYLGENNTLPEDLVIEWCKNNIKDTEKFIDIGAHVGTYAWSVAPYCKEVIAFEPTRHNYNMSKFITQNTNTQHRFIFRRYIPNFSRKR